MPKPKKERQKPEPDRKWFEERSKELGLSIAQLSKLSSDTGNKDVLGRSLRAGPTTRDLSPGEIVKLAEHLKVPVRVIFERLGYASAPATVALIGRVNEHGRIIYYEPDAIREVPAPSDLTRPLVAVEVDAPSSRLAAWHGIHLFYEPATGVRLNAIGRMSVIELGEQTAPIVGTVDSTSGRGTVIVIGGVDRIDSNQIKSATPVLWTHAT